MSNFVTGAAFGAALAASGVYQPSVIISQLKFENWHMIQTFLTAAASSAVIVTAAQKFGLIRLSPRSFSSIGLFAPYDGNIMGGMLLGTGMVLSAACPGTVLAQIGLGVRSGFYALEGAAIGGIVWTGFLERLTQCPKPADHPKETLTIYDGLGVSRSTILLSFDAMCAAIVFAAVSLGTVGPEAKISPIAGGLCITAAQVLSMTLRKSLIGTSTAYDEIGNWFWGACKGDVVPHKYSTLLFSLGMVAGSWLLAKTFPVFSQVTDVEVAPLAAGLGGFLMIIGSRMAGGCTSGHGISGISLLSISSFLTIGTAFAFGGLVGQLLN